MRERDSNVDRLLRQEEERERKQVQVRVKREAAAARAPAVAAMRGVHMSAGARRAGFRYAGRRHKALICAAFTCQQAPAELASGTLVAYGLTLVA
jgi:hypothetical protein